MAASTSQPGQPLPDRGDLVEMLLIHQRNLHTFLLTLLPHEDDVDDLLQQICLALWQKKDSYAPDRLNSDHPRGCLTTSRRSRTSAGH